ncbi:heavy-metal-associated domain-containing protein [Cumulibacter manganitolerans]|uniref:heavy-metal-associated domain-containing protein n=1 Tax=Cumulibacter manganitolerans TaxID=1884992 RepID=UPI001297791B|nr:heavy-metal-associated domain-containing protein [Cumulibacter manganitolerans]
MNAGGRLAAYAGGLAVAFAAAYGIAGAVVPDSAVASWTRHAADSGHGAEHAAGADQQPPGLSLAADGFALSPIDAPATTGTDGLLSFQILDTAGAPLTTFATAHEKELHLIVVRTDGTQFRHVHPVLDASTGTWSMPWTWTAAGSYRVFADFTPTGKDATAITLTRTVDVSGSVTAAPPAPTRTAEVAGFAVTLTGDLTAGQPGDLALSVTRDGQPVTTLQPYLGAYGHLVVLRAGDLAYLHTHAQGAEPAPGQTAGPQIAFTAEPPTAGRYLLYLDFQVDGQVHTAQFVLDAEHGAQAHDDSDGGH